MPPEGSCNAPTLSHTRIFQVEGDRHGSRERDCIIEGCKSRVDGMPSWLRSRRGMAMRGVSKATAYILYPHIALDQTRILKRKKAGEHLITPTIYLIYKFRRVGTDR